MVSARLRGVSRVQSCILVEKFYKRVLNEGFHIELDESWTLVQAHELLDKIEVDFQENLGIELVCHPDPIGVQNPHHNELYRQVKRILKSYSVKLKFHDFQVIEEDENIILNFDILLPDEFKDRSDELYQQIEYDIHQQMGDYRLRIEFDPIDLLEG